MNYLCLRVYLVGGPKEIAARVIRAIYPIKDARLAAWTIPVKRRYNSHDDNKPRKDRSTNIVPKAIVLLMKLEPFKYLLHRGSFRLGFLRLFYYFPRRFFAPRIEYFRIIAARFYSIPFEPYPLCTIFVDKRNRKNSESFMPTTRISPPIHIL